MGCALSAQKREEAKRGRMIERFLQKEDQKYRSREIKLLFVGLPESGKSTVLTQLKIAGENGLPEEERRQCKERVHCSVIQSITAVIQAMARLNMDFTDPARADDAQRLFLLTGAPNQRKMTPELSEAIKRLWRDSGVQECFRRSQEFCLSDSACYFLSDLDRICCGDYIATQNDVLRTSWRTPGITEMNVTIRECSFKIISVSGQRPGSQKWMQCFTDVAAVVVCVALNDYDLVPGEEMNRLHQSMQLFGHVCSSMWLRESPTILLLNKKDLFVEKLKTSPLAIFFPDYQGVDTYEEAASYIQCLFEGLNPGPYERDVITHITCATDTHHMQLVIDAIVDYILLRCRQDPHSGYYAGMI
ncbi:hypothetical protein NDU88_004895 [Pleurodeles waltl]|uniref:Uncharacterized protein n=1 Tax=Pleurodeles waltl TaxID=8319 RepID=A0AAV7V2F8_PLEWA|nr:hypothetical protein NDU88_004895 [Pleurodeles waltl]